MGAGVFAAVSLGVLLGRSDHVPLREADLPFIPRQPAPGAEAGLRVAFANVGQALDSADVIVEGQLVTEGDDDVESPSSIQGERGNTRTDRVYTFRVTKSLRGDIAVGAGAEVRVTRRIAFPALAGVPAFDYSAPDGPALRLKPGAVYLLLLSYHPDVGGKQILGPLGTPAIAEIIDGRVEFLVDDDYVELMRASGNLGAAERLDASFETTSDAVARAIPESDARRAAVVAAEAASPGEASVSERGQALEQLTAQLPSARSAEEAVELARSLGLDGPSLKDEPICRKVESVVLSVADLRVDLSCAL